MDVLTPEVVQDERVLTETAFTRLLRWLDDGTESDGERYLEMRGRLVSYFDRRNRPFADELADETLNRVSRTLEKSGAIAVTPPARYCYVVARYVLLEDIRRGRRYVQVSEDRPGAAIERAVTPPHADVEDSLHEQRLGCLERCLQRLKPEQRDLAVEYYRDTKREKIERRREMARRLGITMNALGIRACRLRSALETCVGSCCRGQ